MINMVSDGELSIINCQFSIILKSGRIDDVMKTPFKKDLRTPRLCNPSAFQLS